jgi:DNA-binding CsgD family transcriptional regulator
VDKQSEIEQAIYEAAIIPERWPAVLSQLTEATDSRGGVLFSLSDVSSTWVASPGLHDLMAEFVSSGWAANNTRMAVGLRRGLHLEPRFVTEAEYYDDGDVSKEAIYQEFFIPKGIGQSAGTIATLPHGDMLCFNFERYYELGPFTPESRALLDGLRPHLMRASMLTARLGMERVRTAVDTLAQLGFAAAALNQDGRVLLANDLFSDPENPWTTRGRDRVALLDVAADELLRAALARLTSESPVRSIPLRQLGQPARHVLHVIPVRRSAHDIFYKAVAILAVTTVRSEVGDPAVLQVLFDLTYAEAVLARRIAAGQSLDQIATESGRSISTLRNQLSSLLAKTGCSRQAELATVLNGMLPPGH